MTFQYSDWQVSSAQGALPAQIVVERWFTAGAYAAVSSNTPAYPPVVIHWNCLLWAPWAPWASPKSISSRLVKGLRWHVPSGGYRRPAEAKILAGLGVWAGVADICAVHRGQFYALELKAPSGRSTTAQIAFRDEINAAGGFAAEAVGVDAALRCLESWGLLRGQTQ